MIILILVVLGLCLGSFVNALVWRVHEQESPKKKNSKKLNAKNLSILQGRSMCPNCFHELAPKDLIPVFSWLSLGGKCRYCRKPISWQYPLIELLTAGLFVASYIWWPYGFGHVGVTNFTVWLIVLTGMVALTVYDIKWQLLPNRILFPLIILAAALRLTNLTLFNGGIENFYKLIFSLVIASGFFYLIYQISKGKWIGGGDVKLGFLIGLIVGTPALATLVLFTASLLGTATISPGLITKKLNKSSRIPFGPFLIVATILVKLFGASLLTWYRRKFLLY